MAFSCTRSKAKDDIHRNIEVEKQISKCSKDTIELNNMNLTDEDIEIIAEKVLRKNKCLSLSLSKNKITSNGIQILVNNLKKTSKLTHLILSSNPIGDQGIKYLINFIKISENLNNLSLCDTQITDNGIKMLCETLKLNNLSIRCIDVRSNLLISDLSVDSIIEMVDKNDILSAFRLDNCGLTQNGKDKLKEMKTIKW